MLTLRQIEVIRAIMVAGTIKGAADMLGVSAPGLSRLMKHTESQVGVKLFARARGRYTPTDEAHGIFEQVRAVYDSVENLQHAIELLKSGHNRTVSFAAVPSIAQHVFPEAIKKLNEKFPELKLSLNVLKIEEAVDYLLLKKGEMVALSYKIDHPSLAMHLLGTTKLYAILPKGHVLADQESVSVKQLAKEPLVAIPSTDPYGEILLKPFADNRLDVEPSITARTGQMVGELVGRGLGVAISDPLTIASKVWGEQLEIRPISEPTSFKVYAAFNINQPRSLFADELVMLLKSQISNL